MMLCVERKKTRCLIFCLGKIIFVYSILYRKKCRMENIRIEFVELLNFRKDCYNYRILGSMHCCILDINSASLSVIR